MPFLGRNGKLLCFGQSSNGQGNFAYYKEVRVAHGVRTEDSYQLEDFNYLTSSEVQSQMQFSITSNVSANVVSFHPHFNLIEPEFPTCLVDRVPFFL